MKRRTEGRKDEDEEDTEINTTFTCSVAALCAVAFTYSVD